MIMWGNLPWKCQLLWTYFKRCSPISIRGMRHHVRVCVCAYLCVCLFLCLCLCVRVSVRVSVCLSVCACFCVCACACLFVCMRPIPNSISVFTHNLASFVFTANSLCIHPCSSSPCSSPYAPTDSSLGLIGWSSCLCGCGKESCF